MSTAPQDREWKAGTRGAVGAPGGDFIFETGIDMTGASLRAVRILPPEGDPVLVSAGVSVVSGQPTKVRWVVTTDHLDTPGLYILRVYAEWADGRRFYSGEAQQEVIAP